MTWINNGTVAVTVNSRIVTGTGTSFATAQALPGDALIIAGLVHEIATIDSDTQLTLVDNYPGATASGVAYKIQPTQSRNLEAQQVLGAYIAAGAGKFGDGTLEAPGIAFTGDPDTGVRRTGANALSIVAGGADAVTINDDSIEIPAPRKLIVGGREISGETQEFTPSLRFQNIGDSVITYTEQRGRYQLITDLRAYVDLYFQFTTNAYTSASGAMLIEMGDFPFDLDFGAEDHTALMMTRVWRVVYSDGDTNFAARANSAGTLRMEHMRSGVPAVGLDTSNFPPDTVNFFMTISGSVWLTP
ncbi:MAG: hypothetical protein AAFN94_00875 [Pseudomonadota bacterium]